MTKGAAAAKRPSAAAKQPASLTPAAVIADPALLGPAFAGASWATWRAVLKAAYAEPLDAAELDLFRAVAGGREPPRHRVRELIAIAGRRSGKDSIASAIATAASIGDYTARLRPGERASVLCLAVNREQALIVHRYIAGYFAQIPLLRPLITRELDDGLELSNGVEIIVATNSFRSVRGRTIVCAIFDEAAFWRSDDSATPDVETYNAVVPGMITLPDAVLILITTAYRRAGLAYQKWHAHFGKNDDDVLVVYGPSTAFNPSLPQAVIDAALERDAEAAGAEWLSQWRSDLSDFLDSELIDAAIDQGVPVRAPQNILRYQAFADPSGGRGDSFTLGIAHAEGNRAVLDLLYEKRAPFDPSTVVAEIAVLLRGFGLSEVRGDKYAASWVVEAFAKEGIAYRQAERDRSAIYLDALPLFTAGRVRLLDNARLKNQLASLERRTSRIGKDRVDHPPGGADDSANSACGALVAVAASSASALWHRDDLLLDGKPAPIPQSAVAIYASAAIDSAGLAVLYWAVNNSNLHGVAPLTLLDFDLAQALSFDGIRSRLAELMTVTHGRSPGLYAPAILCQHARGLPSTAADHLLVDRPALALAIAAEIARGRVKIAEPAWDKSQLAPLPFHFGLEAAPSAGVDAALIGIGVALPADMLPARAAA